MPRYKVVCACKSGFWVKRACKLTDEEKRARCNVSDDLSALSARGYCASTRAM